MPKAMTAESTALAAQVTRSFDRKRRLAFAVPAAIIAYLIYAAISFDIMGLSQRARMDNAMILLSDFVAHKTHVTRDNRTGDVVVAIEGENKGTYPAGLLPDWVSMQNGVTTIDLGAGHIVTYSEGGARFIVPSYGTITITEIDGKPVLDAPTPLPDWISVSPNKVSVTTAEGRFGYSRSKVETLKYHWGICGFSLWTARPMARDWANWPIWPQLAPAWTRRAAISDLWPPNGGATGCGNMAWWSGPFLKPF